MFKEQMEIKNNKIIITISCEIRRLATEPKVIYDKRRIDDLIEDKYKTKITLEQAPQKEIGNFIKENVLNTGTWIFKIKQSRRKVSTPAPKSDTITKKQ